MAFLKFCLDESSKKSKGDKLLNPKYSSNIYLYVGVSDWLGPST